jgi:glycosyltransferase involved in cell wall biosynthesis
MISIIICARNRDIPGELRKNIAETIGVEYEIIVIDNSENKLNIFTAYNMGVEQSKYPLLLFMHDDIHYHTAQWGQRVLDHFKDEKVGAIGVAGGPYVPSVPGGWWSTGAGHLYLLQSARRGDEPVLQNYFPAGSSAREVVVLDGVWFCIRRTLFNTIRFDDKTFSGFHLYDLDISMQVFRAGYKLLSINDILIHHFSSGVLDGKWISNLLIFHKKWKPYLPASAMPFTLPQQCSMEYRTLNEFMSNRLLNLPPGEMRSRVYLSGLRDLLSFRKGLLYFKTPFWGARIFGKYVKSLVAKK